MKRTKQVIIIRRDLNCRRGKEISQGSHASLAVFTNLIVGYPFVWYKFPFKMLHFFFLFLTHTAMRNWLLGSFRKICVPVQTEEEMLKYYNEAKEKGILCSLIKDSGKTEFHGVPTHTAVCIGPDFDEVIDPITGHLKPY